MGKTSGNQEPLIGQIVGGRYEVVRLIGKGGMGSIYEVRSTRLGRSFAMKTLSSEAADDARTRQRFRREADVIARIKHPNIVEVVDWESLEDGSPAMVMEYLRGEDLSKRLEGGPLAWPFLARVADQMLAALSIAHAIGVLHRDLKPQNVFLAMDDAGDECVKLLDFGVSKVRDSQSFVTTDDRLLGTPAYMAPEQADGRASDVDTHSDVWAIGVILHEMATGAVPFSAQSVPSLLYKICHGSPASLLERRPDAPPAFVELVTATLERDIDRRIADATVLRVRLREALRDVAGVQFVDTLPVLSTVASSLADLRTAPSDAIGATPTDANSAVITADPATSSVATTRKRRTLAWVALAIAGLAATVVVIAIFVATRDRPGRSAASSTIAKPGAESTGTAAVVAPVEAVPPPDASIATGVDSPHEPAEDLAGTARAKRIEGTRVTRTRNAGASTLEPANTAPPKVELPRVEPKKKCAKDDIECLYGDGT